MRTIEEIKTYLMLNNKKQDDKIINVLIKDAKKAETKYTKELDDGIYEYAVLSDFINSPFVLEDEDLVSELKEIETIGGIVVYQPIFKK